MFFPDIKIPPEARSVVLRVRHSLAVPDGSEETKTLTYKGVQLCHAVGDHYGTFTDSLCRHFNVQPQPACVSSPLPSAFLTAFLVTGALHITRDDRLRPRLSLQEAPSLGAGSKNLYEYWRIKALKLSQMIRNVALDPALFGDHQPHEEVIRGNEAFLTEARLSGPVTIVFDHEPMISIMAARLGDVATDDLCLKECQAFVFFMDEAGRVISVQKYAPRPTLR